VSGRCFHVLRNSRLLQHVKEALPHFPAQQAIDMELIAPCRLSQRDACSDVNYETFTVWVGSARPCPASLGSYRGPVPTRSTIEPARPQRSSIDIVVLSEGPYPSLASLLFPCTAMARQLLPRRCVVGLFLGEVFLNPPASTTLPRPPFIRTYNNIKTVHRQRIQTPKIKKDKR
jgi:hypothetical protein